MKNKILTLCMCVAMLFSSGIGIASAEEDTSKVSFETKVMRGLFVVDSDFETNPDDEVTRGDFVRILMDMIEAPGAAELTVGGFSDLSKSASYSKAVIYAANMGYVNGYGDGTFRANNAITAAEAVTTILKVAGYDIAAIHSGGYSDGYLSLARSQNMLKGISSNVYEPMTKKDMAVLLYNTLSIEVYSLTSSTTNGTVTLGRDGELFMEAFMSLAKHRDIITSTYVTSLTGAAACVKGEITLGNTNYDCAYEKAEEYLGYRVEAYTKEENNEETLVFAIPYKTEVLELKCEDISEDSTNTLIYYEIENEDKLRKQKVSADADKIVNGTADIYSTLEELISVSDTMIFIDNDEDGAADVVIVFAYDEMYVGGVSLADEIIYSKYTFDGVLPELELEDTDELIITKNGAEAELKDIKENDILTIIKTETDSRNIVKINACDKKISGVVTGIDKDEDLVYIDNEEYKLSDLYSEALEKKDLHAKKIELSMSGTFYLNSFGRIAVVIVDDSTKRYGFLKKAYIDDGSTDECVKFKILGTDGDWQLYQLDKKVKLGSERVNAENIFSNGLLSGDGVNITPQMLEFELNRDSKIKAIQIAEENGSYSEDKFRFKKVANKIYRTNNRSFDSETYISGNTVTFSIPRKYNDNSQLYSDIELSQIPDKYFLVNSGAVYSDWTAYDLNAYNCDKYGYTELLERETNLEQVGEFNASNFLFNRLTSTLSSDDTEQIMIEGLHGTNIAASAALGDSVIVYDKDNNVRDLSYLERGDLLRLYMDVDNNVYRIDVVFKVDKASFSKRTQTLHAAEVYLYGYVTDIDHERGFLLLNDGLTEPKSIRLDKSKISVYKYETKSKNENITIGNINDIQKGDYLLLKGSNSLFDFVVIYE